MLVADTSVSMDAPGLADELLLEMHQMTVSLEKHEKKNTWSLFRHKILKFTKSY